MVDPETGETHEFKYFDTACEFKGASEKANLQDLKSEATYELAKVACVFQNLISFSGTSS